MLKSKEEQALETAKLAAFEEYPRLQDYGFQAGYDPDRPGKVEFFPPGEGGSPQDLRPEHAPMDIPYISVRQPKYINPTVYLGEALHYAPKVDPYIGRLRETIRESLTPEQLEQSRRRYNFYVKNYGEERPYDQWFEISDLDAIIRGYLAPDERNEWAGSYTPKQEMLMNSMKSYLKGN
jgi:hypothetical protein